MMRVSGILSGAWRAGANSWLKAVRAFGLAVPLLVLTPVAETSASAQEQTESGSELPTKRIPAPQPRLVTVRTVEETIELQPRFGRPIPVYLSPELDERRGVLSELILQQKGWTVEPNRADAQYTIAPNPEFPDDVLLFAVKGRTPETVTAFDPRMAVRGDMDTAAIREYYSNASYADAAWASNVPQWIDLGAMDREGFVERLTQALQPLLRRHALLALEDTSPRRWPIATCVASESSPPGLCPMPRSGRWNTVPAGPAPVFVHVEVPPRARGSFVSVIAIAPDGGIMPVLSDWALAPATAARAYVARDQDGVGPRFASNFAVPMPFEQPGRYEVITIVSQRAIHPDMWRQELGGPALKRLCEGDVEPDLCAAMLGAMEPAGIGVPGVSVQTVYATTPVSLTAPIVGGSDADARDAPWQAQLFLARAGDPFGRSGKRSPGTVWRQNFEKAHRCGGSYLGDGYVLTSAHCIPASGLANLYVRLGTLDMAKGGIAFPIQSVAMHRRSNWTSSRADVALIRLKPNRRIGELEEAGRLVPITIARGRSARMGPGVPVLVTGWGFTGATKTGTDPLLDDFGRTQRNPRFLKKLTLQTAAWSLCDRRTAYDRYAESESLCVISPIPGRDACYKDSGGPLTRAYGGNRYLVGIVTAGIGCAQGTTPSLYTRASSFRSWVKRAMDKLETGVRGKVPVS